MAAVLETRALVKRFGGLTVTDGLDFTLEEGELHAVIGPNGAGKSTLVNLLSGELGPSSGDVLLHGRNVTQLNATQRARLGLSRSYQVSSIFPGFTVLQNVVMAILPACGGGWSFWREASNDRARVARAEEALELAGLAHRAGRSAGELAHGEKRQLEIAMALAGHPRVLLLDEPLAGMSQRESLEMVQRLRQLKARYSMLLIEHDMKAVFALADRATVLVYGKSLACGRPEDLRGNEQVKEAYLGEEGGES
ncbi:MAG TPA: ABC transporter ATP-binding protein [Ramlibacter sp.]|nr:ABC transporter ATP-binding protein [Ramlibacter sp.]